MRSKARAPRWAQALVVAGVSAAASLVLGGVAYAAGSGTDTATQFQNYCRIAVAVMGVIAVASVVLAVHGYINTKQGKAAKKGAAAQVGRIVVTILCIAGIVGSNIAATTYSGSINSVFTKTNTTLASTAETTEEDWYNTAYQIAEEGMVLLKNEEDSLPLAEGTKVNLLGYYAYNPYYSGSGSGTVSTSDVISIKQALEDAGFEVNSALESLYPATEDETASIGFDSGALKIDEISIDSYTGDTSFESMKSYSNVAVVVLGRSGGEGYDLSAYDGDDYLQLEQNEKDLLQNACDTFDTVIVVLNMANAMNMDQLSTYDVDAIVWAGEPGPYGFKALGEILNGTVNPSGKLPDTWVYDNDSAPANENFGEQQASNASDRYYVDYVEGIYVGYKWYETAYAEQAVITNTTTGETFDYIDYESVVAYPFGYGLSYTTFTQEITGGDLDGATLDPSGTYTVEVTVTNTGDVAGKDVVELYVTSPYTDYDIQNGIEKAEVVLVAYDKTDELEPGASQTLTLEVSMEDIASYDSTYDNGDDTMGTYMLDEGDYVFSVRTDSHTVVDEVTASVSSQHFYSGDDKRSTDQQAAYNQFDEMARGEYLSRNNGFENYESAMNSVSDTVEDTTYATSDNYYDASYDEGIETLAEGVDYDAGGSLTLADMEGLDYDDPKWDELISQLSIEDLKSMITDTLYKDPEIESIGRSATTDSDGPMGINSMFNANMVGVAYPCMPLLAATFNDDLAAQMGSTVADQALSLGCSGWYAPAMDTHRSAYSGRNFEYYSEDATLAAGMAASEVNAARSKGLICFVKHYALNDMESQRDHVHVYANEQTIREVYLKPFESAVKDGGTNAIMTSMSYLGDVYAAAHEGLVTEILRNEWGFQGCVLTDMDQAGEARSAKAVMRAGTDKWLSVAISGDVVEPTSDADIYYMQRAAHNILYMQANATRIDTETVNWQVYLHVLWAELGVIALACAASAVLAAKAGKETTAEQDE